MSNIRHLTTRVGCDLGVSELNERQHAVERVLEIGRSQVQRICVPHLSRDQVRIVFEDPEVQASPRSSHCNFFWKSQGILKGCLNFCEARALFFFFQPALFDFIVQWRLSCGLMGSSFRAGVKCQSDSVEANG